MKKIGKSSLYLTPWCYFLNKSASSLTHHPCLLCNDSWLIGKNHSFFFYEETCSWEGCEDTCSHLELEDRMSCSHIPPETPSPSPGHSATEVLQLSRQLPPAAVRWSFPGSWKGQSTPKLSCCGKAHHFLFYHHWKGDKIVHLVISVVCRPLSVQLFLL